MYRHFGLDFIGILNMQTNYSSMFRYAAEVIDANPRLSRYPPEDLQMFEDTLHHIYKAHGRLSERRKRLYVGSHLTAGEDPVGIKLAAEYSGCMSPKCPKGK